MAFLWQLRWLGTFQRREQPYEFGEQPLCSQQLQRRLALFWLGQGYRVFVVQRIAFRSIRFRIVLAIWIEHIPLAGSRFSSFGGSNRRLAFAVEDFPAARVGTETPGTEILVRELLARRLLRQPGRRILPRRIWMGGWRTWLLGIRLGVRLEPLVVTARGTALTGTTRTGMRHGHILTIPVTVTTSMAIRRHITIRRPTIRHRAIRRHTIQALRMITIRQRTT